MIRPTLLAALILGTSASAAVADGFLIRPYLQNVTASGATIFWETRNESPGWVAYGETDDCPRRAGSEDRTRFHRVRLEGLAPGRACHYRVAVDGDVHQGVFRTAPEKGGPVTFLIVGGSASWDKGAWENTGMAEHAAQWNPDLFIHTGNMVTDGRDPAQWPLQFERFAGTMANVWMVPVRGTGEGKRVLNTTTVTVRERPEDMQAFMRSAATQQAFRKKPNRRHDGFSRYFELPGAGEPYAAFDWGDTHFVLLSYDAAAGAGAWVNEHLASVDAANVVVAQHLSIYTAGYRSAVDSYRAEVPVAMSAVREALESHGVLLDLAGQAKIYERTHPLHDGRRDHWSGVTYLTQGGAARGGFPEWFTAVGGLDLDAPGYTVVHLDKTSGWLRTFAWDKAAKTIVECDYNRFWRDISIPRAVLARLKKAEAPDLPAAVEEVGALAYAPAVETLLPLLESNDTELRRRVARALRRIGAPKATGPLMACLRDPGPTVRREAARALEIALDPSFCRPVGDLALEPALDHEVRAALLGALAAHGPYYFAMDTAELVLRQADAPPPLRERAAWVIDRVATRDDVDTLLSLVLGERQTYPLLRIGHALDRLCAAKTDLAGDGALAKSKRGRPRDTFIKAWKSALDNLVLSEAQRKKRAAFEKIRHRRTPARLRTPVNLKE